MTFKEILKNGRKYPKLYWGDYSLELKDKEINYFIMKEISKYPEGCYVVVGSDWTKGGIGNQLVTILCQTYEIYDKDGVLIDKTNKPPPLMEVKEVKISRKEWMCARSF